MILSEIINNIIAGGLLGALGQGIRTAVGLKKFNEENANKIAQGKLPEEFSSGRLIISIFIGFVAGAIGMIIKGNAADKNYTSEDIITIIAIGYSGADFIEGVFNTYADKFSTSVKTTPNVEVIIPPKPETPVNEQPVTVVDEALFTNKPAEG